LKFIGVYLSFGLVITKSLMCNKQKHFVRVGNRGCVSYAVNVEVTELGLMSERCCRQYTGSI